jgi:hypothetical protein
MIDVQGESILKAPSTRNYAMKLRPSIDTYCLHLRRRKMCDGNYLYLGNYCCLWRQTTQTTRDLFRAFAVKNDSCVNSRDLLTKYVVAIEQIRLTSNFLHITCDVVSIMNYQFIISCKYLWPLISLTPPRITRGNPQTHCSSSSIGTSSVSLPTIAFATFHTWTKLSSAALQSTQGSFKFQLKSEIRLVWPPCMNRLGFHH